MIRGIARAVGALAMVGTTVLPVCADTERDRPAGETASAESAADASGAEHGLVTGFLEDVGRDYVRFLSKETVMWLALGGAGATAIHSADQSISEWAYDQNTTLTGGRQYGSQWLHIPVAAAWWLTAGLAGSERHADTGRDLLRAQISVVSWTYAIKYAAQRTRPNGDPHSFPSGHASTSFASAMVLQEHYGWKVGLPMFAAGAYAAISRVYENQHWASDVIMGAAIGLASGRTVTLHLRETKVTLGPLAVPGGGGVLLTAINHP